ncbi:unnamed protein product [Darwinula stevensoni]|uniref:Uncharacterized protein n=1 Tax=Darwinula stevensoni TaxID=69355 RepID=A0A7R9AKH2_9CRUS|nr:unnamed protein product [Darwinula stevensoni]CAG0910469.1 unnamed protein product [Darwinula stevensoni]
MTPAVEAETRCRERGGTSLTSTATGKTSSSSEGRRVNWSWERERLFVMD